MDAVIFIRGIRFGLMLAQWLKSDQELISEKDAIARLNYKTKTLFLRELVMCENPKLHPVIIGKMSRRQYKVSEINLLISNSQMVYDAVEAKRRKKNIY